MLNSIIKYLRHRLVKNEMRGLTNTQSPQLTRSVSRFCVFCHDHVDAWKPYRIGSSDRSPFLMRLETIGSNVERFSCPRCWSTDRERHLHLFFDRLNIWDSFSDAKILHMAPELKLGQLIRKSNPSLYVAGDLFPQNESIMKVDLECIPFEKNTFDTVICNHVMEHVTAPKSALREIHRVLKPGARFICQTPFASLLTNTFEEPLLQTEAQRLFFYGQEDHVRLFGLDIKTMIIEAGFNGRLIPHEEILSDMDPEIFGVNEKEPFFDFHKADPGRS
jgi:predicted SAM-dependent methyltransferase